MFDLAQTFDLVRLRAGSSSLKGLSRWVFLWMKCWAPESVLPDHVALPAVGGVTPHPRPYFMQEVW
ncbi:MAG TPA: hypothetical protein VN666_17520 [Nitrospira sp.]|nr:hypothetical protein [Nitrospira sp.]